MLRLLTLIILLSTSGYAEPQAFTVDGPCTVAFSPAQGATAAIVQLIGGARSSIRILAYNFTSPEIGTALIQASERGVDVALVLDKSAVTEKKSLLPRMLQANIPTWIDRKHHIAHNKVIIVDDSIIETGSFNYTGSAEKYNAENAMICPSVSGAAIYLAEWELHKNHSEEQ